MPVNLAVLGSGIDIIEISRIKDAVNNWGDHFLKRVFCSEEIAYALNHRNPFPHYAARFAAKEAVIKALGDNRAVNWKGIKILNDPTGKPYCVLTDKISKNKIIISMSHSKNYAVASAIITQ